jgi:hypothetical protein
MFMAILKLALGRENALSGTISAVDLDTTGRYGAQWRVTFDTNDVLYLPKDAVERQCERAGKTPNELIGEMVTFWRKPMPDDPTKTKGYLNLEFGAGGTPVGATRTFAAGAQYRDDQVGRDLRANGVAVSATTYEEIKDRYVECLADAVAITSDAAQSFEAFSPDAHTVSSVAATLFIERNKRGV